VKAGRRRDSEDAIKEEVLTPKVAVDMSMFGV
jgi:hypothetical protein